MKNSAPEIAIIIPACDEEACIGAVLGELRSRRDAERFVIAVGVNHSSDRTAEIARSFGVLVAETPARGYGFGCTAAIELVKRECPQVRAYIFLAGDGASDPADLARLLEAHAHGHDLVLGARTFIPANWPTMKISHVIANFTLALWCGALTGRWFRDLAPVRLIGRELFERLALTEMTYGWTIEAQVGAALLNARIREVPARERPRLAGEQKVSGVNWGRTFRIGCRIVAAGWRARRRFHGHLERLAKTPATELLPQVQGASR